MNFWIKNKNTIILLFLTIVFMALIISQTTGRPNAGIVSDTIGVVLKPFNSIGTYVHNSLKYGKDADKFETENTLLKQQLITATQKAADYDELAQENAKLRSMLELAKTNSDLNLKACNVISSDTQNWSSVIKLDKGISDGIKKNDAVITEAGLVGYVSEVGRGWANVVTIMDSSSSVGAVVERMEEHCIVQGDITLFDEGKCSIKYLTTETSVTVGDIITTSGTGGIYPEGIVIGKVDEIKPNSNGLSWDAVIDPVVDFGEIREVFAIAK